MLRVGQPISDRQNEMWLQARAMETAAMGTDEMAALLVDNLMRARLMFRDTGPVYEVEFNSGDDIKEPLVSYVTNFDASSGLRSREYQLMETFGGTDEMSIRLLSPKEVKHLGKAASKYCAMLHVHPSGLKELKKPASREYLPKPDLS